MLCVRCKQEKPRSNFYLNQTNRLCKSCRIKLSAEVKKNNVLASKEYVKRYSLTEKGKKAISEASKRAFIKHREKWLARAKARYAVSKGILKKPNRCEVCEKVKPLQGHHEDYSKPLEIIWLCSKCHAEADKLKQSI